MKIRYGFVSNSSSSSFIITNKTNKELLLSEFIKDVSEIVQERWNRNFVYNSKNIITPESLINSLDKDESLMPGENYFIFGDENEELYQRVLDYTLREPIWIERFQSELDEILH